MGRIRLHRQGVDRGPAGAERSFPHGPLPRGEAPWNLPGLEGPTEPSSRALTQDLASDIGPTSVPPSLGQLLGPLSKQAWILRGHTVVNTLAPNTPLPFLGG